MNVTKVLQGASRLPLTIKRGNKDFYKGTGQAYVPGGGHRTGPPGKHVVNGKAKFRVMDDKVRYFVGPGQDVLNKTQLRPYAQARDTETKRERFNSLNPHVPFSPNVPHHPLTLVHPTTGRPFRIAANDTKAYGKWYRSLSHEERMSVIAQQRKKWFEGMVQKTGGRGQLAESVTEPEATTA